MILFLTILLVVYLFWVIFKPSWLPTPPDNKLNDAITTGAHTIYKKSTGWVGRLKFWGKRKKLAQQFETWVGEAATGEQGEFYTSLSDQAVAFQTWFANQPQDKRIAFAGDVAVFCEALKFDLAWLVNPKLNAQLKREVEETVLLYVLTVWNARDVLALAPYFEWQTAPNSRKNRAFAQQLYAELVSQELATAPPDLWLADERKRLKHVNAEIERVAKEHPDQFVPIVKDIVASFDPDKPAPEPSSDTSLDTESSPDAENG